MKHYIPTISKCLKDYPFLEKTFRKDYYRFKEISDTVYDSLSVKPKKLYQKISQKEEDRFWNIMLLPSIIGIICSGIGFILSILSIILRSLGL